MSTRLFFSILIISLLSASAPAQESLSNTAPATRDTITLTIKQAEELFLKNNLSLITQRYNIDAAKAEVITAKLFDNPEISFETILYNPANHKVLDFGKGYGEGTNQLNASLSQLFRTAGKRNKNIQLANISVQQVGYQYFDLLRTLRYTLRNDFYTIYYQQQSEKVYADEINSLQKTLVVFEQQFAKGNIAKKEVLRLKSQLYSLQTELNSLKDETEDVQSELKLLTRLDPATYIKTIDDTALPSKDEISKTLYSTLIDSAYANRNDLKIAQSSIDYSNLNLKLQKAMAVPDITVFLTYDKQGNYQNNYNGLGISFPLPFLNRNQGNIKQAKIAVETTKTELLNQQDQIQNEIANGYEQAIRLEKLFNSFDPQFQADFNQLIVEVYKNYEKRNISLLEFLDFYESYKTNTLQMNNLLLSRRSTLENLNYVTATSFFNK